MKEQHAVACLRRSRYAPLARGSNMFRDIILWLAGVPIFVIILLHLFGVFH